jgi:hypothetical protein
MSTLIAPDGQPHEVLSVRAFARKHGLDQGNVYKVINGERQHHKGWRSPFGGVGFKSKPYAIERYIGGGRAA